MGEKGNFNQTVGKIAAGNSAEGYSADGCSSEGDSNYGDVSAASEKKRFTLQSKRLISTLVIIAVLVFAAAFFGQNKIVDAFGPLTKYIPGVNALIMRERGSNNFYLPSPVTTKSLGKDEYVKVLSSFTEGKNVKVVMESNLSLDWKKKDSIGISDQEGNRGRTIAQDVISDGVAGSAGYKWNGSFAFELNKPGGSYNLLIKGYKIPVVMSKMENVADYEDYGNVAYNQGIRVAAFTKYKNNILEVKVAGLSDDGAKVISFANGNLYLVDKQGKKYSPVSNSNGTIAENTYYFNADPAQDLKLVIPYILLADQDKKAAVKLKIPQEIPQEIPREKTNIDLPYRIGQYEISIVQLQRTKNEGKFSFRRPGGKDKQTLSYSKNGLQIIVDKKFDYSMNQGLYDFSYNTRNEYLSICDVVDGKKVYYTFGDQTDNKKYGEPRYKIINLINFPLDQKTLDITFEDPTYYRKGDWNITLKR